MVKVLKLGQIAQDMMVNTLTEGSMVLGLISGMMAHNIQVNGRRIRFLVLVYTHG